MSLFKQDTIRKDLRPHQVRAIEEIKLSLGKGNKRIVCAMPTGSGKTLTAARIIEGALSKGNEVLFTVPYVQLVDQTVDAFECEGIDSIGVIQASHPRTNPLAKVQIATVQSLANRAIPPASLIIVDECHINSKVVYELMSDRPDLVFIGLSATPFTQGMGRHWQDLVVGSTIQELIDVGYLCPFRVYAAAHPDLTGIRIRDGDYAPVELEKAMNEKKLVGDVVSTWLANGENRPTLAFGVNRAHASAIQAAFIDAGISAAYCDAYTDRVERQKIEREFRAGEIKVVASVRTLIAGVDWPVACIIDAQPTRSEALFLQKIGRGLRVNPPWKDLIIFDHSDNTLRMGFVTDIKFDRLDKDEKKEVKNKEKNEKLPKECANCSALMPPKTSTCPFCGHEIKPPKNGNVESVDGELVEIVEKQKKPDKDDKQKFYSMALKYAELKGYKKGWAANKYREKFKVWPRSLDEVTEYPDAAFMNFIKARQIAYAKKMEKARA